jgi:MFS family permease
MPDSSDMAPERIVPDRDTAVWLAFLAFASSLVGQFIIFGTPLFLRSGGASSAAVGLIFLVAVPYVGRFLWAPLLDRFGSARHGQYRTWIVAAQVLVVACLSGLSLADPATTPSLVIAGLVPLSFALGTIVMAIDALTVRLMSPDKLARAVAWQRAGTAIAGFSLGGGLLYGLGGSGWSVTVAALALVQAAALVVLLLAGHLDRGKTHVRGAKGEGAFWRRVAAPFLSVFTRPGVPLVFAVGALATLASDVPYAMKSLLLTDAGFSVADAGLVGVLLANACGFVAVLIARPLVERAGSWRATAILGFGGVGLAVLFLAAGQGAGPWAVASFTVVSGSLVFAASVAGAALLYPRVDPTSAAAQVSSFSALSGVVVLLLNGIATAVFDRLGLALILGIASIASLIGIWLAEQGHRSYPHDHKDSSA